MNIYETLEQMFNDADIVEKCHIADSLKSWAKKFNLYIDDNYYPCPNGACGKLIKYGEAVTHDLQYEVDCSHMEHIVRECYPELDTSDLELQPLSMSMNEYYCPHCGSRLFGDYENKMWKWEMMRGESK